ncbi:MAG: DUF502 domain-containing protein [Alkaliphilus sp.]|nr:DUF502 domain-containing protein [Alkaliphilus sp.]
MKMKKIRKIFFTGLLAIIPIAGTIYLMFWFLNLVDSIFRNPIEKLVGFPILGIGVVITVCITLLTGVIATNYLGREVIFFIDKTIRRIPIANSIYTSMKQLIDTVFMEQKNAFKSVVLIQYPSKGIYVLGFITSIAPELISDIVGEPMKNIFVPTTPNPTTGMLVMIPEKNIICLRMPVDAAVKIVVSGGILVPEMNEN